MEKSCFIGKAPSAASVSLMKVNLALKFDLELGLGEDLEECHVIFVEAVN